MAATPAQDEFYSSLKCWIFEGVTIEFCTSKNLISTSIKLQNAKDKH